MNRFDGTLALKLDFGGQATTTTSMSARGRARTGLRLASGAQTPAGPEKYHVLERRRRTAQIRARRLLDLIEER